MRSLSSYLKYPCNDESFALANAIRVVYEFATGCRLNPTLPKKFVFYAKAIRMSGCELVPCFSRTDLVVSDQVPHNRVRTHPSVPIQPSSVTPEELQFIQNTLPTWLTEIEATCASA